MPHPQPTHLQNPMPLYVICFWTCRSIIGPELSITIVSGIGGTSSISPSSTFNIEVSSLYLPRMKFAITAIVLRVTCDLPLQPVHNSSKWNHISDLSIADPEFGMLGRIDLLLGADIYADILVAWPVVWTPWHPYCTWNSTWMGSHRQNPSLLTFSQTHFVASHCTTTTTILVMTYYTHSGRLKRIPWTSPLRNVWLWNISRKITRSEGGRFIVPLPKNPV